jgi:hypothetical protein
MDRLKLLMGRDALTASRLRAKRRRELVSRYDIKQWLHCPVDGCWNARRCLFAWIMFSMAFGTIGDLCFLPFIIADLSNDDFLKMVRSLILPPFAIVMVLTSCFFVSHILQMMVSFDRTDPLCKRWLKVSTIHNTIRRWGTKMEVGWFTDSDLYYLFLCVLHRPSDAPVIKPGWLRFASIAPTLLTGVFLIAVTSTLYMIWDLAAVDDLVLSCSWSMILLPMTIAWSLALAATTIILIPTFSECCGCNWQGENMFQIAQFFFGYTINRYIPLLIDDRTWYDRDDDTYADTRYCARIFVTGHKYNVFWFLFALMGFLLTLIGGLVMDGLVRRLFISAPIVLLHFVAAGFAAATTQNHGNRCQALIVAQTLVFHVLVIAKLAEWITIPWTNITTPLFTTPFVHYIAIVLSR